MNLKQLHYVSNVAKVNSFSLAARECHVTQPTLSNAVALLEDELGAAIFLRSTRSVSLSTFGETLLPYIEAIIVSQNELVKAAAGLINPQQKLCRLGLSPVVDSQLLQILIDAFSQKDPNVEFIFKECLLGELDARVEFDQIDFVFRIAQPLKSCEDALPFYQEPLYFLPADNSYTCTTIEIGEISKDTFVLGEDGCGLAGVTKDLFRQHGLELNLYRGKAINYSIMEEWAGLGIGSTILPISKISKNNSSAIKLTVNNNPIYVQYEIAWNKTVQSFSHLKLFKQHLLDNTSTLLNGRAKSA